MQSSAKTKAMPQWCSEPGPHADVILLTCPAAIAGPQQYYVFITGKQKLPYVCTIKVGTSFMT